MPRPFNILPPLLDQFGQAPQTAGIQTRTLRQYHLRVKKKLRLTAGTLDMDMRRLSRIALVGVEEEALACVAEEGWYGYGCPIWDDFGSQLGVIMIEPDNAFEQTAVAFAA